MKNQLILTSILIISLCSCSSDNDADASSSHKGIIQFKSYTLPGGLQDVIYSNNSLMFKVELQLTTGASQNVNADLDYHILEGTTKISEGKVKVNKNLDGGLGMFWGADEHSAPVNGTTYKGKTLTVFLDPSNKNTAEQYTTQIYIDLYKKASVTIP
ncbi:MAG: hypothetical protein ACFCUU_11685 [Cyclobacteriaceae bacterium]